VTVGVFQHGAGLGRALLEYNMSDYQRAQRFAAELSDLAAFFNELGDLTLDQAIAKAEDFVRNRLTLEDRDATIRYLEKQGKDTTGFFQWLVEGARDLKDVLDCKPCEYRSRPRSDEMECLLATALIMGRPVENSLAPTTPPAPQPESSKADDPSDLLRVCVAIAGENVGRILTILQRHDLNAEEKMRAVVKLEPNFRGKTSTQWGTILGTTANAVRGFDYWKQLQEEKKRD
jgi:hypothetical protein